MATYTDSATASASTAFNGLWIHDPLDPQGTVVRFLYGKSSRSKSIDVEESGLVFAGRAFPVMEYGEHQADEYDFSVQVPNGSSYLSDLAALADFAESRRTLCVRDNRGKVVFGTMTGYKEQDQDWGSRVSFSVSRVDYDESVI